MAPTSHYSSYPVKKTSDDEDDDLDALRKAALKTLYSKKRKVCFVFLYFISKQNFINRIIMIIHQFIEILVHHQDPILHHHPDQVIHILLLVDLIHHHHYHQLVQIH
jgi:hypothetical protein